MDGRHFDTLLRSLSTAPTRRGALRLLSGTALASLLTLGATSSEAKKKGGGKKSGKKKCKEKGKETICHQGQTIQVSRCAVKAHERHGDTVGACATPNPGPPPPLCTGENVCQGTANASCTRLQPGASQCACFVAVGSGAPHCGVSPQVKSCTAETGCGVGETCIDLTGCGSGTACSPACPNPL